MNAFHQLALRMAEKDIADLGSADTDRELLQMASRTSGYLDGLYISQVTSQEQHQALRKQLLEIWDRRSQELSSSEMSRRIGC